MSYFENIRSGIDVCDHCGLGKVAHGFNGLQCPHAFVNPASAREEMHAAAEAEPVVRSELEPEHTLHNSPLPTDAQARKAVPIYSGVLRYFPDALAAVAECSKKGNDQHNPGKPLHWDRSKSQDEHDALVRHLMEAGTVDTDGVRHSTKVAWRALAALQKEIERDRAGR